VKAKEALDLSKKGCPENLQRIILDEQIKSAAYAGKEKTLSKLNLADSVIKSLEDDGFTVDQKGDDCSPFNIISWDVKQTVKKIIEYIVAKNTHL